MTEDREIDIAFRALNRYFKTGWLWDEQAWSFMNPKPPAITDDECRLLSMQFPVNWQSLRRAFPSPKDSCKLH